MPHKRPFSAFAAGNADIPSGASDVSLAADAAAAATGPQRGLASLTTTITRFWSARPRFLRLPFFPGRTPQRLESSQKRRAMEVSPPSSRPLSPRRPPPTRFQRAYASFTSFFLRDATNQGLPDANGTSQPDVPTQTESATLTHMQKSALEVQKTLFSDSRLRSLSKRSTRWAPYSPTKPHSPHRSAELRSRVTTAQVIPAPAFARKPSPHQPAEPRSQVTAIKVPAAPASKKPVPDHPAEPSSQATSIAVPVTPSAQRYRLRSLSPTKVANDQNVAALPTEKPASDGAFLAKVFENVVATSAVHGKGPSKVQEISLWRKEIRQTSYRKKVKDDTVFMEKECGKRQKLETPEKEKKVVEIAKDVLEKEKGQSKGQKLETPEEEKKTEQVIDIVTDLPKDEKERGTRQKSEKPNEGNLQEVVKAATKQPKKKVVDAPKVVTEAFQEVQDTIPDAMEDMKTTHIVQIADAPEVIMEHVDDTIHETAHAAVAVAAPELPDYEELPDVYMGDFSSPYVQAPASLFPISPSVIMPPPSRRPLIPQLQITIPQNREPQNTGSQEMEGIVITPTSTASAPIKSQEHVASSPSQKVFIPTPATTIGFMPSKSKHDIMRSWGAKNQQPPQTPVNVGFAPSKSKEQILQSWAKKEAHTHPMQTRSMTHSQVAGGGHGDDLQLSLRRLSIQSEDGPAKERLASATKATEESEDLSLEHLSIQTEEGPTTIDDALGASKLPQPPTKDEEQSAEPSRQQSFEAAQQQPVSQAQEPVQHVETQISQTEPSSSRPVSRDSFISGTFMLSPHTGSSKYPFSFPRSESLSSTDWQYGLSSSVIRQANSKLEKEIKAQRSRSFADNATDWVKGTRALLAEQEQAELFGRKVTAQGYNTRQAGRDDDDEEDEEDESSKNRVESATKVDDKDDDTDAMAARMDADDGLGDIIQSLDVKDDGFDDSVAELIADGKAKAAEKDAARRASEEAEAQAAAAQRTAARAALKMDEAVPPAWASKFEDIALHGMHANAVPEPLSVHDLRSLRPRTWLNDAIVNEYLKAVCDAGNAQRGWKKGTFPPPLVPYMSQWYTKCLESGVDSTKGWSRRHRWKDGLLLNVEAVLFPINQANHWTLLIIYPSKRQIEYLDSFGALNRRVVDTAVTWLKMELGNKFVESEWDLEGNEGVLLSGKSAEQTNGYDCGVFVCFNALARVKGVEPALGLHQDDLVRGRVRVGATLLNGGFKGEFGW